MKLTLNEILSTNAVITETNLVKRDIPAKTAYKLMRIIKKLGTEIESFDAIQKGLVDKYGKKKEDGSLEVNENGLVGITDVESYNKEITDVLKTEIEINVEPLSIEEFGETSIPTSVMIVLEKFLK